MDIREFSAFSRQGADWTEAFRQAIAALRAQGGGILTVPPGEYPTGAIRLFSYMTLDIQNGARLRFLSQENAYPLIELEFEGIPGILYQPCIFAQDSENIRVTGDGVIDGQGDFWWEKVQNHTLKHPRPYLICFAQCCHVTIENVTLVNSPVWTVHPLRCEDVSIRGLRIRNPVHSPNTDGINPDGCRDVRIHDCTIDVGDDCIAIKSGTEQTLDRRPCERIIISNCHFLHGHGGVVLGSEMSGDIRNVAVSHCIFSETDRGIRLKTRRGRGGTVEGVQLNNLVMEKVMCPFVFNMYYSGTQEQLLSRWDKAPYPVDETTPALRSVSIFGVHARKCAACAGYFYGLAEMPVEDVSLRDITVEMEANGTPDYPAMMKDAVKMQGAGFFLRNVQGLTLEGVRVLGTRGKAIDADGTVQRKE